jgi:hypothetical protein
LRIIVKVGVIKISYMFSVVVYESCSRAHKR